MQAVRTLQALKAHKGNGNTGRGGIIGLYGTYWKRTQMCMWGALAVCADIGTLLMVAEHMKALVLFGLRLEWRLYRYGSLGAPRCET